MHIANVDALILQTVFANLKVRGALWGKKKRLLYLQMI